MCLLLAIHLIWAMNSELCVNKLEKTEDFETSDMWARFSCLRFASSLNHSTCTVNNNQMTIEMFRRKRPSPMLCNVKILRDTGEKQQHCIKISETMFYFELQLSINLSIGF